MSEYCLDTSGYSRFQRGEPRVVDLLDRARWVGVPSIVLGELRFGFALGGRRDRNEELLSEFLLNAVVEELGVDGEVSRHYAAIAMDLRVAGTPIPTNDLWIAATAVRSGSVVLTYDQHFGSIARVGSLVLDE